MKRVLFVATAIVVTTAALAQDHLTPEAGPLADAGEIHEYYGKVREVFADVFRSDLLLQVVYFRAPEPEEMAGIRKTESGFEAFASKPSSYIWETYSIFNAEKQSQGRFEPCIAHIFAVYGLFSLVYIVVEAPRRAASSKES